MIAAAVLAVVIHGAQFSKPSVRQQVRLGESVAASIRNQEKILPVDDPRVIELRKVATRLLSNLPKTEEWNFSFDVIDNPDINAFSLPGGPTFFFTGLMSKLKTEDELAGVLGHELTHVRRQHWATQYAASMRRDVLLNLGLVLIHANNDLGELVGVTDQLVFSLPFSRNQEREADEGGFEMVTTAGYNPIGLEHVFQVLQNTTRGDKPPLFLSDHPSDKSRIQHIDDLITKSGRTYPPESGLEY